MSGKITMILFFLAILFGTSVLVTDAEIIIIMCFCIVLYGIYTYAGSLVSQALDSYSSDIRQKFDALSISKINDITSAKQYYSTIIHQGSYFQEYKQTLVE